VTKTPQDDVVGAALTSATRVAIAAALFVCAATFVHAQATQPYKDPSGRFTFQYPKKNWQVFPGAGSSLATIGGNKGRTSVQIEYLKLNAPIKVDENYELIVGIETEFIRDRQPGAEQIKGVPMRPDLKDIVVVDYVRPGVSGVDRVRQYSIINGVNLFRVSCVAPAAEFPKLQATFEQIAKSFVITGAKTS
jgi:hypothetical protein